MTTFIDNASVMESEKVCMAVHKHYVKKIRIHLSITLPLWRGKKSIAVHKHYVKKSGYKLMGFGHIFRPY